ncbi:uncharacterized protein LOC117298691 [Asterias rubens]|uniref:uncharacterized protein LOC117298691 n=1 Tax=Asterias rubens TaxID=7604 RepID=UPI0014554673|nr:uncharacterized protein LOC117298691 [Asterias rubens]
MDGYLPYRAERLANLCSKRPGFKKKVNDLQQESPHVLPKICIICRSNKYIKDKLGRRQLQGLSTCALVDGGDKEIFRLTKLKKIFDKVVRNVEGNDSSTYRAWSLKQRLRSKFPQLNFLQPNRRNESVLVYVDTLATEELFEKSTILTESSISSDTDTTDTDSSVAGEES